MRKPTRNQEETDKEPGGKQKGSRMEKRGKQEGSILILLIKQFDIDPKKAFMAEDIAANLHPAAERGMATLLVKGRNGWPDEVEEMDHVHHRTDLLAPWLTTVTTA